MDTVLTAIAAAPGEVDALVRDLEQSWVATITFRRQSKDDVGYRDIYVSIDDQPASILRAGEEVALTVQPGTHRIKAHNTLFRKRVDVTLGPGEHATLAVINRAGFGTYSVFAFLFGGGPLYLTLKRETPDG